MYLNKWKEVNSMKCNEMYKYLFIIRLNKNQTMR